MSGELSASCVDVLVTSAERNNKPAGSRSLSNLDSGAVNQEVRCFQPSFFFFFLLSLSL